MQERKMIKRFCIECMGFNTHDVISCQNRECQLWGYRHGRGLNDDLVYRYNDGDYYKYNSNLENSRHNANTGEHAKGIWVKATRPKKRVTHFTKKEEGCKQQQI